MTQNSILIWSLIITNAVTFGFYIASWYRVRELEKQCIMANHIADIYRVSLEMEIQNREKK